MIGILVQLQCKITTFLPLSTTLLDREVLCAGTAAFCAALWVHKSAPSAATGSTSSWRGPMYALLFLLDLPLGGVARDTIQCPEGHPGEPGWSALTVHCPRAREMQTVMLTSSSGPEFPQLPESSCSSLQFLWLVFQKLFNWLSVIFRTNCSKCTISICLVCCWEEESSVSALDLPPHLIFN